MIENCREFVEMCSLFGEMCPDVHISAHAPRAPQLPCGAKGYNFRPEEPAANRIVSAYMAPRSDLQSQKELAPKMEHSRPRSLLKTRLPLHWREFPVRKEDQMAGLRQRISARRFPLTLPSAP